MTMLNQSYICCNKAHCNNTANTCAVPALTNARFGIGPEFRVENGLGVEVWQP
jgi:hypothetical protein